MQKRVRVCFLMNILFIRGSSQSNTKNTRLLNRALCNECVDCSSFEPNSTKGLKPLVSYIASTRLAMTPHTDDAERPLSSVDP